MFRRLTSQRPTKSDVRMEGEIALIFLDVFSADVPSASAGKARRDGKRRTGESTLKKWALRPFLF